MTSYSEGRPRTVVPAAGVRPTAVPRAMIEANATKEGARLRTSGL
jgi:hypothetical protein